MSIADRTALFKSIEEELGDVLTVTQLNKAMGIISSHAEEYQIEHIKFEDSDTESFDLLTAFLSAKAIEGRSTRTIAHYRYIVSRLIKFMGIPISKINVFHIRTFLMMLKDNGNSERTINCNRDVFNSFFGWLYNEGFIEDNPTKNISAIKYPKKIRLPFSDVDIALLKEACESKRDAAILYFLLATGCRISELCALNRDSINLKDNECIVFGKGSKERTVYLDDVSAYMISRYLDSRTDSSKALFIGKGTTRMTPGGIRFILKSLEEKSGVTNVHPHRFRRTLATNLINHGMPIQEVAAILGHEKLDTTMKYVYISQDNVKYSYNKYI